MRVMRQISRALSDTSMSQQLFEDVKDGKLGTVRDFIAKGGRSEVGSLRDSESGGSLLHVSLEAGLDTLVIELIEAGT